MLVVSKVEWEIGTPLTNGPVGIVVEGDRATPRSSATIPAVGGVPTGLVRAEELVDLDGDAGTLSIAGIEETRVVTAFLQRSDGQVLLLRRSGKVRTFQGRWAAISGYLEAATPLDQALTELREETGLAPETVRFLGEGTPVLARDGSTVFVVHPLLFHSSDPQIRLDWEHTEAEWVTPAELARRQTVPQLAAAWEAVQRARSNRKPNGP